jgi:hypothetical protein
LAETAEDTERKSASMSAVATSPAAWSRLMQAD